MSKKKSHSIGNFFSKVFAFFFYGYIAIMIIGAIIGGLEGLFGDPDENSRLADGFTIEKYNVVLDVKEDNKIDVTENLTVNFTSEYKHGIFKFTPLWLKYTGKDGNTIKRKANISNYRAVGDPYSLDTVKRKERIKIGSASEYVGAGEKTYVIKYTYDMGKDPFKNFDELIFHAYGDYWGTEIKNASIQVNMPKSIEGYKVNFFKDKYRENNVSDVVDYTISGNTLYASYNADKDYKTQLAKYCDEPYRQNEDGTCDESWFDYMYEPLMKSLTVDIELPDGYFVGGSWNYGWGSFIISMIILLLTAWTIYKWIKFGKDHAKKAQTVEFYPPDNLSAAEVGYVFNKRQANKKLTISLIVQLASKGYIKIDDLKNKNKDIQITNLVMRKPKEPTAFEKTLPKRSIVIKKLKDMDDNLSRPETTMMVHLFKKGDTKVLESNIDKFLEVKDKLVNGGYIEILDDNEKERYAGAEEKKSMYDQLVEQYNTDMEKYTDEISKLPALTSMERIVYDRLFESKDEFILSEHKTLYKAFNEIESELKSSFKDKVHDKQASKQIVGSIVRNIIILILSIISYRYVEDLDPNWRILYTMSFICIFINLFFTIFMKRKTEYGELITARVKGFRHFLITAEKPRLEALVAENPNYFYNILPYTYAMNISKKWIKKFENIPMPEMDMGTFNYGSDYSYYSLYNDVYYPEPVHTSSSSSSSGCSSCGGGCSSCGGGCSSCGGGGSW